MRNSLLINEFRKIKSTPAFWISILGPFLLAGLVFMIYLFAGDKLIRGDMNPYDKFLAQGWSNSAFFLIPLFVVLLNSLILNVEHSNGGWKVLLTSPVSRLNIYLSKWAVINILNLFTHFFYALVLLGFVYLLSVISPDLGFKDHEPDLTSFFWWTTKIFIGTLALSTLQYELSLWIKNSFKTIGIGIMAMIAGLILMQWEHVEYYPYAFPGLSFGKFDYQNMELFLHEYLSLAYTGVFLIIGWFLWRNKQFR